MNNLSVDVLSVITQGVFTLLHAGENNSATHSSESFEIAEDNEWQLYDEIFFSMMKRKSGVMWKPSIKAWVNYGAENCYKLTVLIESGEYKSRRPITKKIYYPKAREVKAIPFRDRIWQGYLNDRYIYQSMTNSFIWSNTASQLGKGTDKARELLRKYLWNFYTHYKTDGYVLHIDIHHYYQSIDKDIALFLFNKRIKHNVFNSVEEILTTQYQECFYAGSQMIQILGIAYLDELDHFIKEKLHIRYYVRYQDDFILIHPDKRYLEYSLIEISQKLKKLKLSFNEKKTFISSIKKPILWLGFLYSLQEDGKIYIRVNPKRVKEIRRRLKKHPESLEHYKSFILKGKSYKLYVRLEELCRQELQKKILKHS